MKGWISIHRKIKDNMLWQDKPFSKGQAWVDILLEVNHKEKEVLIGNSVIEVGIGEKITSIRKLCDRWGWSNTKVKNFLDLLKKRQMINYKSDTKKTVIKVLNYSKYQQLENEENDTKTTQKHIKNISKTYQKHTNNNVNNDNKDNKDLKHSPDKKSNPDPPTEIKFDSDSMPYKAAAYLRNLILENHPRQPVPKENPKDLSDWSLELDRLNRLGPPGGNEGFGWQEIGRIMNWCQQDSFWKGNILSASKFREKIITLETQMNRKSGDQQKKDDILREIVQEDSENEGSVNVL